MSWRRQAPFFLEPGSDWERTGVRYILTPPAVSNLTPSLVTFFEKKVTAARVVQYDLRLLVPEEYIPPRWLRDERARGMTLTVQRESL